MDTHTHTHTHTRKPIGLLHNPFPLRILFYFESFFSSKYWEQTYPTAQTLGITVDGFGAKLTFKSYLRQSWSLHMKRFCSAIHLKEQFN